MKSVLTIPRLTIAAAVFCSFIIVGLFIAEYFRILPSIGIAGITLTAIAYAVLHQQPVGGRNDWRPYAAVAAVFFIHAAAGLNTEATNMKEYSRDVVLQSPFLLLPLAFWLLPGLPAHYLKMLWLLFIGCTVTAALAATGNYLLHQAEINEMYLHSKIMPTEPDHIRFSLMVTLAAAATVVLLRFDNQLTQLSRWLLLGAIVWLALFQHLLAVRSGLVTFYAVGVVVIAWLLFKAKAYRHAALVAVALVLLPVISYGSFPTFRNKFVNTQEDLSKVDNTDAANNYSLVARVYSYKVAAKIIKANPWFGVSKADMADEMAVHYSQDYPVIRPESYIQPHNQFIYLAVAFGLVGVVVFTLCFYYPLLWTWPRFAPLVVIQYGIVSLSFLVEYTLETQIGLTYSLFFILLGLNGLMSARERMNNWRPA
ncbi:O-antigen ligase family protein [Hymenobacter metallicola]|uniref:O-antigen ligase domain-containing protein n=1 Tax=Hymenobacter metallicola TaxID=2563114 RepID=A0A4Z0QBR0_9BACT|nr:O-antigen ligase family protein [Hymenobacter metallicola]TGE27155.1 O-antigen ligase domain-containing protein [Hymenobacter metallicola]